LKPEITIDSHGVSAGSEDLFSLLVHPTKVAIIEALRCMERPMSAAQLSVVLGGPDSSGGYRVFHHVHELAGTKVLIPYGRAEMSSPATRQTAYRLREVRGITRSAPAPRRT
jgi:CBS-domain-containing membrane protein